jgi:hypothetical protein
MQVGLRCLLMLLNTFIIQLTKVNVVILLEFINSTDIQTPTLHRPLGPGRLCQEIVIKQDLIRYINTWKVFAAVNSTISNTKTGSATWSK